MGLLLFYALAPIPLRATSLAGEWHESTSRAKVATVLVGALFIVFSACYFGCYDFYPTWDSINYWQSALDFNKSLDASELQTLFSMFDSIGSQDYNLLICWVVSLLVRIFPSWVGTLKFLRNTVTEKNVPTQLGKIRTRSETTQQMSRL